MGLVPFPHCVMLAPKESLRAVGDLNMLPLVPLGLETLPARSPLPAFCRAEVRFEACWPGGETDA